MLQTTVLCAPGWACLSGLPRWFGADLRTLPHDEQAPYLLDGRDPAGLLPAGPWGLVTWSMGTWLGVRLSRCWADRPPRWWLALSPFLDLVGPGCKVGAEAHRVLHRSFLAKPVETLAFFLERQGGRAAWFDPAAVLERRDLLGRTLLRLGEPGPEPPRDCPVPLVVALGGRDRLVDRAMTDRFAAGFRRSRTVALPDLDHALLYEEPAELRPLFEELRCCLTSA